METLQERIFKAVVDFCPFIASCVVVQLHFSSDQHLQKVNRTMHKPGSYQSWDLESHIKLQTGMFYVEANPDLLFVFFFFFLPRHIGRKKRSGQWLQKGLC